MVQVHPRPLKLPEWLLAGLLASVLLLSPFKGTVGAVGAGAVGVGASVGIWKTHGHGHHGGTTGSGTTTGGSTTTSTEPPPASTANVWIQLGGGACSYSGAARSLGDSIAGPDSICGTLDQANDICPNGGTVKIIGGSYGNQTLTGTGGRTNANCTMTVADGESVTIGYLNLGEYNGGVKQGPDWLTIQGNETQFAGCRDRTVGTCSLTLKTYDATHTNHITLSNFEGNAQNTVDQCFHSEDADNFIAKRGLLHGCLANGGVGAMIYTDGTVQTFEDLLIYDGLNKAPNDGTHTECMYATSTSSLTLRRVQAWSCSTEDIFLTGSNQVVNLTVEDSIFQRPSGPNNNAFKFRTGGSPSPVPINLLMRNNLFAIVTGPDSLSTATGTVVNNYFNAGGVFCGGSLVCTNNDTSEPSSSFVNAVWTSSSNDTVTSPKGDFTITSTSGLRDAGTNSNCPALDFAGNARPAGSSCDIGAYEYQP